MKTIILCGGIGMRLKEETEYRPKPMVEIGGKPILWHIMNIYAHYGFKEFVLALGFKGDVIRNYFLNYEFYNSDFTVTLSSHKNIKIHRTHPEVGWKVTLVETGDKAMTGARIKRCEKYISEDNFMVTYGDGLGDVNLNKLVKFHMSHGAIGTLIGINPPTRWGELITKGNDVIEFREKPKVHGLEGDINGGFMVFRKELFKYLTSDDNCVFEKEPLERLAREKQLKVYHHDGFWQCMDTYRDYLLLNEIWESGKIPWQPSD
ncbi:MAG: glucose-1-phosphate cytidylyltransferase [bacterium]|nr:glucose-1-phosphate cytidylyltransferase [bacterium]